MEGGRAQKGESNSGAKKDVEILHGNEKGVLAEI